MTTRRHYQPNEYNAICYYYYFYFFFYFLASADLLWKQSWKKKNRINCKIKKKNTKDLHRNFCGTQSREASDFYLTLYAFLFLHVFFFAFCNILQAYKIRNAASERMRHANEANNVKQHSYAVVGRANAAL